MNRPMALVCYICGRQFGTKSLGIHIKSCQQKWENQQNHKPPKQRRPCPQPPPGLHQLLSKDKITRQDIVRFNNGSFNTFMQEALVECEYCGRKFNQKSLVPHQKACMKQPMIRKPYVKKQEKQLGTNNIQLKINDNFDNFYQNPSKFDNQPSNQNLVPCHKCGRTFNPDRVAKHQKVCKQSKQPKTSKIQQKVNPLSSPLKPSMNKNKGPLNSKPAKWKVQHEQLQNAMKAMRQMKKFQQRGGDIRTLPPPPPSNYDHYIACKYCGRKYAPDVAQRHIPKCANIINKPGGIQKSKIQQKYIGSSGVKKTQSPFIPIKSGIKKVESPFMPTNTPMKSYQLTKPSYQHPSYQIGQFEMKSSLLKPNMKVTPTTNLRKK